MFEYVSEYEVGPDGARGATVIGFVALVVLWALLLMVWRSHRELAGLVVTFGLCASVVLLMVFLYGF